MYKDMNYNLLTNNQWVNLYFEYVNGVYFKYFVFEIDRPNDEKTLQTAKNYRNINNNIKVGTFLFVCKC